MCVSVYFESLCDSRAMSLVTVRHCLSGAIVDCRAQIYGWSQLGVYFSLVIMMMKRLWQSVTLIIIPQQTLCRRCVCLYYILDLWHTATSPPLRECCHLCKISLLQSCISIGFCRLIWNFKDFDHPLKVCVPAGFLLFKHICLLYWITKDQSCFSIKTFNFRRFSEKFCKF